MARKPADQTVNAQDIIIAAADVLQRCGYETTTMKDIAAAVNLTAASLYHHFSSKDSLLLAVLEAGLEFVLHQIEPIALDGLPPEVKLRQMIHAHIEGLTQNTAVGAAMVFEMQSLMTLKDFSSRSNQAELLERRNTFFERRDHFENLFRHVITEGIAQEMFLPVDVPLFVKALLGAHNWVGVWYRPSGRLGGAEIADVMADTFLRALKP